MVMLRLWLLGSQYGEQAFMAARSMSSTFSSICNFGVLRLVYCLQMMQIQAELQHKSKNLMKGNVHR